MNFKEQVYHQCMEIIQGKINALQSVLDELRESIRNETKSTAGDKHETARAHLQIEQENTGRQLKELIDQKAVLEQIDMRLETAFIVKGSLVKTNKGYFFISVAAGKMITAGNIVFALSPASPLGTRLMGLKAGDTVKMNNAAYKIETID